MRGGKGWEKGKNGGKRATVGEIIINSVSGDTGPVVWEGGISLKSAKADRLFVPNNG